MKNYFLENLLRVLGHQRYLPLGLRDRIIRKFSPYSQYSSENDFITPLFDLKYHGDFTSYIDRMIFFYGCYERNVLLLIQQILQKQPNSIFIDIGANTGQHSLFASQFCKSVYAYEPYPKMAEHCLQNIQLNNIQNIHLRNYGLGNSNELLSFYAPENYSNMGIGSFLRKEMQIPNTKIIQSEIRHASQAILAENELLATSNNKISLIKIDTEGFEKNVLFGLQEVIHQHQPTLLVEFDQATKDSFVNQEELFSLFPKNYQFKSLLASDKQLVKLEKFDFDVVKTILVAGLEFPKSC